jgi:nitrogen-specific signal transduction histidine kinase/CheY-like chemotaxis protein
MTKPPETLDDRVDSAGSERMQTEKMAALGRLASGVAHEINNPASFVLANLDSLSALLADLDDRLEKHPLLARQAGVGKSLFEAMTILQESKEGMARIYRIVRDLRSFARTEEGNAVPVDVNVAVDSSLRMTRNELRYRATIERDLRSRLFVLGGVSQIGQVLVNLILNAAQALGEREEANNRIIVRTHDRGDWVVIEVQDNGPGIDPAVLPRIFDNFFTTKPAGQGTGLGLSICRDIIRGLGGHISVESTPGKGARFIIYLPAMPEDTPAPEPMRERILTPMRRRVLAIDDEALLLKAYRRMLIDHHDVETKHNAADALSLFEQDRAFDIVLCDLQMPGMSGAQLFEEVRLRWPELADRFIFVTGGAFTPDTRKFLERGVAAFINKPFQLGELLELFEKQVQGVPNVRSPIDGPAGSA